MDVIQCVKKCGSVEKCGTCVEKFHIVMDFSHVLTTLWKNAANACHIPFFVVILQSRKTHNVVTINRITTVKG